MRYEIDIFHYLGIYKKEWKRMASLIAAAVFIAALMGYLQPTVYKSTAMILSTKEGGQSSAGGYLNFLNLSVSSSPDDIIFSVLKSARMRRDVNEHFNLKDMPKFWWSVDTYLVTGGFVVEVKGPDPEMTKDIANFTLENLDEINMELQITSQKPMVKVLDPAVRGSPIKRDISRKVAAKGLIVFTIYSLFVFFREYLSHLKIVRKMLSKQ